MYVCMYANTYIHVCVYIIYVRMYMRTKNV